MSAYRSILFDLGNVLVRFDPVHFWTHLGIEDVARQQEVKPLMLDLGRLYESGTIPTHEFRRRFSALFEGRYSDDQLNDAFLAVLPDQTAGTEDLVKRVGKHYELALVSNTNPIHFELCLRTTPALKHFDRFYVSYELGALKPHADFYAGVVNGEDAEPQKMIFIDDLEENVDGARTAGFTGIQFTDAENLEKDLIELGIL